MIEGRSSDRQRARAYAFEYPDALDELIEILVEATIRYLTMQASAGAQALQIFESWAGKSARGCVRADRDPSPCAYRPRPAPPRGSRRR